MSNNPLAAAARAELATCQPKNLAEECVLEAIGDALNPPDCYGAEHQGVVFYVVRISG
jgi:hypothetical protein